MVSTFIVERARTNGKRLLSAQAALEIAWGKGMVRAGTPLGAYLHIMRQNGVHSDQISRPASHTIMRSRYPNHVWQFDVSVCVLAVMDEKGIDKNKSQNIACVANQQVLLYLVSDHYSGAFNVHYYQVAGEDQQTLFNFLMEAFSERSHEQGPFRGMPQMTCDESAFTWIPRFSAKASPPHPTLIQTVTTSRWLEIHGAEMLKNVDRARVRREPAFGGKVNPFDYL
ncbi:hypothetical protein [Microbulbifer pacificus]|uniref:hypothetical protein n=1 Tax=Microbulbifer pacificus TaxID=407164 RepID=UPI000CF4102B|nr:hypothetical protein [Microbulbifer pacificus]